MGPFLSRLAQTRRLLIQSWLGLAGAGWWWSIGIETGDRWSDEAVDIFRVLAFAEARESPLAMKWPVVLAWERRWRMLATSCCVAFASSLVDPSEHCDTWRHTRGEAPSLSGLMEDDFRKFWRIDLFCARTGAFFHIFANKKKQESNNWKTTNVSEDT